MPSPLAERSKPAWLNFFLSADIASTIMVVSRIINTAVGLLAASSTSLLDARRQGYEFSGIDSQAA